MVSTVKVPPDGGYGWVIVLANALSNLLFIPMMQSFGLIFKDTFTDMGLSATQISLIINLNAAFGMMMGLVNGVLLKLYGYRKIAFMASAFSTVGIVLTSFSTTFGQFMVSYGLVTSLGFGMNMSAYSLALNSYFKLKKSQAVGYAMTLTGLGPILMPQLITLLVQFYDVHGVTLILGGVIANSFVSASLLQPIKWHMKHELVPDDQEKLAGSAEKKALSRSVQSLDAPVYGMDTALAGSVLTLHSIHRKPSEVSLPQVEAVYNPELSRPRKDKSKWRLFLGRVVEFFDFDLLKDPIYVNILMGLSIAIFAELNFSILTAYILAELGLNTNQSATFMSVLGVSDIIFRFLAPYIGSFLGFTPRRMYMITLSLLMLTRYTLLMSADYYILLGVAFGLGIAKGFRTVYMTLVVPTYVPIEKLASASGLQMMINGICIMIGGPIIGLIRDVTGSYNWCIVVLNFITFTTIVIWSIEMVVLRVKRQKKNQTSQEMFDS